MIYSLMIFQHDYDYLDVDLTEIDYVMTAFDQFDDEEEIKKIFEKAGEDCDDLWKLLIGLKSGNTIEVKVAKEKLINFIKLWKEWKREYIPEQRIQTYIHGKNQL